MLKEWIREELGIKKMVLAEREDYKERVKLKRIYKDIMEEMEERVKEGEKVLICVNTVDKAQQIYRRLKGYNGLLLHGRFTTRDREKKESLDIDYDRMYTEQRCGRVNRKGLKGICEVNIYNLDSRI